MEIIRMLVRKYRPGEERELWQIFFQTVRTINRRDYTEEQVRVWAADVPNWECWESRIRNNAPYVCLAEERIVGFADLQSTGYIDQFFVHCQWQGKGIGRLLMARIQADARALGLMELWANVSITAKLFFAAHGFCVVAEQRVALGDVWFDNFKMVKRLTDLS